MSRTDDKKANEKKLTEESEQIKETETVLKNVKPVCGIIMPISPIDGCSKEHWEEVRGLLSEAINSAGYEPRLVSEATDSGIIQKRIVQNIYNNEIVVCDVSGKNPNVMFELGMRLAFDKPTIIVIDDNTNYSFDTAPIEHISYPRDLSYYSIINFKETLKNKIIATINKSNEDPNYTTFLKHFGEFEVSHVEKKEGTMSDVVLSRIDDLSQMVLNLAKQPSKSDSKLKKHRSETDIRRLVSKEIELFCSNNNTTKEELLQSSDGLDGVFDNLADYHLIREFFDPSSLRDYIREQLIRMIS